VIYAFEPGDQAWGKAIKRAALKFGDEIRAVWGEWGQKENRRTEGPGGKIQVGV
jgi:hypothetical protein